MKLSLNTLGCPDFTPDEILTTAHELGFEGIEIRGLGGRMLASEMPELASPGSGFMEKLRSFSIEAACFGASSSFHDASKLPSAIKEAEDSVDAAYRVGIPFVRVFGNSLPDAEPEPDVIRRISDAISSVCRYSEAEGLRLGKPAVRILLETHGDFNTAERMLAVINNVGSPTLGILWDVAHTDRVYGDGYREFYDALKPYICHIHLKNHKRSENYKVCTLAEGDIPLEGIVRTLIDGGYDGFFSYEYEKKWCPTLPEPRNEFGYFVRFMRGIKA